MAIIDKLKLAQLDDERNPNLSVSIGITITKSNESFDEIFRRADNALYDAKYSGKGCAKIRT